MMDARERLDYRHFSMSQSTADMEVLDWSDIAPSRRKWTLRRALVASFADEYASALVFMRTIFLNIDSLLATAIAVASPCFYYYYTVDGRTMTFSLSWTMVSARADFRLAKMLGWYLGMDRGTRGTIAAMPMAAAARRAAGARRHTDRPLGFQPRRAPAPHAAQVSLAVIFPLTMTLRQSPSLPTRYTPARTGALH
jgi:hypothetical protein